MAASWTPLTSRPAVALPATKAASPTAATRRWSRAQIRVVGDASLALEWAVAGAGVIFMTETEQRHDLQSGKLVRLLNEWETEPYPLHALLPSARFVPNRVRALVDFIAGRFATLGLSTTEH